MFNALALFTVHRKQALLSLQFKDFQISLQRDPHGGPPVPLVELTPGGCKKFLGVTKLYGHSVSYPFSYYLVIFLPCWLVTVHMSALGILGYPDRIARANQQQDHICTS